MITFMGKELKNPIIASSCIATESTANILKLAANGVQGAILKSCADYHRQGTAEKRQFAYDKKHYCYASSPFEKEILTLKECLIMLQELRPKTDMLLIPSFTAQDLSPESWIPFCKELVSAGADAIQLDFFYMGCLIGTNDFSNRLVFLLQELVKAIPVPVMPKLNINLPKDYIMPLLVKSGIEYVSLLDSVRSPYLEEENGTYFLSKRLNAKTTSCFGHWQLPLTLGYTYTAVQHGLKVCAGGGITHENDVKQLLALGAVTVQSASFLTKYPTKVSQLIPSISKTLT